MARRGGKMAKSSRGGKRGTAVVKNKLVVGGDTIEFDGDLVYTGKDPNLSPAQRSAIEAWEDKRITAKIEYATLADASGSMMGEVKGGKGSVRTPAWWGTVRNGVFSHIHPRDDKTQLGGTFSPDDLFSWINSSNSTIRAAAKEGRYSISKTSSFNRVGMAAYVRSVNKKWKSALDSEVMKLKNSYAQNQISYSEANKQLSKAFNTYLVGIHNDLLSGQQQYGYNYYLEKR